MPTIVGTAGADVLQGGSGGDTISGAGGADTLAGGGGADTFIIGVGESPTANAAHGHAGNLVRITDWGVDDKLVFTGEVTATPANLAGVQATDFDDALTKADSLFASIGKVFVVAQVGPDIIVIDNQHQAVVLSNTTYFSGVSYPNLVGTASAPPVATTPPPLPSAPTLTPTAARGTITGNMDAAHLSDLFPAIITAADSGHIAASLPGAGIGFDLRGSNFTYDPSTDALIGGSASSFSFTDVNAQGIGIMQMNLTLPGTSVAQFETWLAFDQTATAFQSILSGSDSLTGGPLPDLIRGYAGADVIYGMGGSDSLFGGDGNDVIYAGRPSGGVTGGLTVLRGEAGDDYIVGEAGFDDINGNQGNDTIIDRLGGDDWLVGGQGNDLIYATASRNILYGNLGNDTLVGGAGTGGGGGDLIRGGQGDDAIYGGSDKDWISGDRGNDTLTGGGGADIFHTFSGAGLDRVLDFNAAEGDRVQLDPGTTYTVSQVGADTVIDMGNGDRMILVGINLSSLPLGWIFGA